MVDAVVQCPTSSLIGPSSRATSVRRSRRWSSSRASLRATSTQVLATIAASSHNRVPQPRDCPYSLAPTRPATANRATVSPSIITAHGLTVGNFFVVSPALAEGCGFYTGNLEILSPSVVKGYGLEGLSVQFASPDLIIDAGGVDVFNLKPVRKRVMDGRATGPFSARACTHTLARARACADRSIRRRCIGHLCPRLISPCAGGDQRVRYRAAQGHATIDRVSANHAVGGMSSGARNDVDPLRTRRGAAATRQHGGERATLSSGRTAT